jgi:hypothetical protein
MLSERNMSRNESFLGNLGGDSAGARVLRTEKDPAHYQRTESILLKQATFELV